MFVKNDPERKYVNGSIGKICGLSHDAVEVLLPPGPGEEKSRRIEVAKVVWEAHRYKLGAAGEIEAEVTGTYQQYPLKLAWAITIHKSQGKTFERIIVDMGKGAFEHGQTYVALSRCTRLEGVVLRQRLTPRDILTDPRVVEFYEGSR
jgi:ATP-dependent exoDNAse (exonuclease V) alpha subunit